MSEQEWYTGPYSILKDVTSLQQRRAPGRGDIIAHASGAVILRCPKCAAVQFTRADILNSPDAPTLDRPVQCGAGHCKKCGVWFSINKGRAIPSEPVAKKPPRLPETLVRAGVRPPPKLNVK